LDGVNFTSGGKLMATVKEKNRPLVIENDQSMLRLFQNLLPKRLDLESLVMTDEFAAI
jgi:hypothetical protein